jgi:FkbM family methyltransferase
LGRPRRPAGDREDFPAERALSCYIVFPAASAALIRPAGWPWVVAAHVLSLVAVEAVRRKVRTPRPVLGTIRTLAPLALFPPLYWVTGILSAGLPVWALDRPLERIEALAFGGQPSMYLSILLPWLSLSEALHACYFSYYWLVPGLPFVLAVSHRREDAAFVVWALCVVFSLCLPFFIWLPVSSPFYNYPPLDAPLSNGFFYRLTHFVSGRGGVRGGAFPSSHAALTLLNWLLAWRLHRGVFWVTAVPTLGLLVATVYGRWHYALDTVAGVGLAVGCYAVARRHGFVSARPAAGRWRLFGVLEWSRRLLGGRAGRGGSRLPVVGPLYVWAYRRTKPHGVVWTRFRGASVYVNADDPSHEPILAGSDFNDPELALCTRILRPGMVALDVGANIGVFAIVMSRAVGPQGRIYAFEPEPSNCALLERNLAANGCNNVTLVRMAVSDSTADACLALAPHEGGDNRLDGAPNDWKRIPVQTTTLDDYFRGRPHSPALVKVDVQGAEARVLRGMRRLLDENPNMALITELSPTHLVASGDDPSAFLAELVALGFRLYHIRHDRPAADALSAVSPEMALRICAEGPHDHINLFCARGDAAGMVWRTH